jgi:hypothetical protein
VRDLLSICGFIGLMVAWVLFCREMRREEQRLWRMEDDRRNLKGRD